MIETPDPAPALLGTQTQLVNHGKHRVARHTTLGLVSPVAGRAKRRLDGVRRAQMCPVLGRKVIKRQQAVAVLLETWKRGSGRAIVTSNAGHLSGYTGAEGFRHPGCGSHLDDVTMRDLSPFGSRSALIGAIFGAEFRTANRL